MIKLATTFQCKHFCHSNSLVFTVLSCNSYAMRYGPETEHCFPTMTAWLSALLARNLTSSSLFH